MLSFTINPSKKFDIEGLRIAIFSYILSKQSKQKLLIRISEDKQSIEQGKDKEILQLLNLFSIDYENIIYESDNLKYHQKLAMQLMSQKKAFACFCSDEKLEELKEEAKKENKTFNYDGFCEKLSDETVLNVNSPFTVRIKKPKNIISFEDKIKGNFSSKENNVDSFIILKHDKHPTFNYACAIDDMLYDISIVIKEEKDIFDTFKQIHIRNELNYDKKIQYIHLKDILNSQIAMQNNEINIKWLIEEGFLPAAIANYLVLLSFKTPKEIFSLEESIKWFDIKDIFQSVEKFDLEKLRYINKKHLELMDEMRLSKILGFADEDIGKLAKIFLEETSTIKEIKTKIDSIFKAKSTCEAYEEEFVELKLCMQEAPFMNNFEELKSYLHEKTSLSAERLSIPLRYILTGNKKGPKLNEIYPLIKNYLGEITK